MVMAVVSLALTVILLIRKKSSVYRALALGLAVFTGLVLLDTAVLIRHLGLLRHGVGHNLGFALDRLFHGSEGARSEVISNLIVFIPFGFFLAEFLAVAPVSSAGPKSTTKRFGIGRRLGVAALTAFGLSLCIELLQLVLKVGYFEQTDLVLNTLGGFVGALMSVGVRKVVGDRRHSL